MTKLQALQRIQEIVYQITSPAFALEWEKGLGEIGFFVREGLKEKDTVDSATR